MRIGVIGLLTLGLLGSGPLAAVTLDGDLGYTSDYVFRGVSATGGRDAGQIDLRLGTLDGTFVGAFASSLHRAWQPGWIARGWDLQLQEYAGHRFDLSTAWSTTVTATNYAYLRGNVRFSNDYQEISVAGSYLDLWTVSVAYIPSAVYFKRGYRLGRYPAYVGATSAQIPLLGPLLGAVGAGYYGTDSSGYLFANLGLAIQYQNLRLEAGYYVAQQRAASLFPYGRAGNRFAASATWHFSHGF